MQAGNYREKRGCSKKAEPDGYRLRGFRFGDGASSARALPRG